MSIRLTQSILIAGAHTPVDGATLSLGAAMEAGLVNSGKAVYVVNPSQGGRVPVMGEIDDVTGEISLLLPGRKAKITSNASTGNRAVLLGDSMVANGYTSTAASKIYTSRNFGQIAAALLNQRLNIVSDNGKGGDRIDQFAARFAAVEAQAPDWVIIVGGFNDFEQGLTGEAVIASLQSLVSSCFGIGAQVLFLGQCFGYFSTNQAAKSAELSKLMLWAKQQARLGYGVFFQPIMFAGADYSTKANAKYALPATDMATVDNIHATAKGAHKIARLIAKFFDTLLPAPVSGMACRDTTTGDINNLILNGTMSGTGGAPGTGNSGTLADDWTGARTGTIASVFSQAARTDEGAGQWQICTLSGATAATDKVDVSGTAGAISLAVEAGKTVRVEVDVDATASTGTIGVLEMNAYAYDASWGNLMFVASNEMAFGFTEYCDLASFKGRLRCPDFVVPATATRLVVHLIMGTSSGGAAVVKFTNATADAVTA